MEILAVENLSFTYPECSSPTIKDISFTLKSGDFTVLCGATGCGKSTLLHMLKREITPLGEISGNIIFCGTPLQKLSDRDSAAKIGFVMQRPEYQIVTDKAWHELAFGLENLGVPKDEIFRRIAEISSFFGISQWYKKDTSVLSGGQKQLLNLAAVLAMQPELLILDEPTAQLDPVTASDFINAIKRINQELGITVFMAEHRLEEAVPLCDRLIIMEKGRIIENAPPAEAIAGIRNREDIMCGMPAAARLYSALENKGLCPLTVRDGRNYLENAFSDDVKELPRKNCSHSDDTVLEFKDVFFRYERNSPDILSGLNLKIYRNEIFCILGGNGSGKTTSLNAAAGLIKIYSGNIRIFGKKLKEYKNRSLYKECLSMLPQDVQTVFLRNSVREELEAVNADISSLPFDLSGILEQHPYDLSGGQQQLAALAVVLAAKPKLLLLDEPTKGLDAAARSNIINIVKKLKENGMTVVIVSHDIEFAAMCADRCAMFFDGRIVSIGEPENFFSENNFYTTAVNRMTRHMFKNIITLSQAEEICRLNKRRDKYDSN